MTDAELHAAAFAASLANIQRRIDRAKKVESRSAEILIPDLDALLARLEAAEARAVAADRAAELMQAEDALAKAEEAFAPYMVNGATFGTSDFEAERARRNHARGAVLFANMDLRRALAALEGAEG